MIDLDNVSKIYDSKKELRVTAVQHISLQVAKGEFLVITGRSGSGKTTLLNLAAGLTRPTSGTVCLDGVDLWSLPDSRRSLLRNQKIGFIFQFPSLLPAFNALENVLLPAIFSANKHNPEGKARAAQLLDLVGLKDKLYTYPRQLSAGQQQRVVIARALFNRPEMLMADEPTSNLDEQTETEIMELFRSLHAEMGLTILLVTHTTQLVGYGTRSIQLANGQVQNGRVPED